MVLHAPLTLTVHSHLPGDERLVLTMATRRPDRRPLTTCLYRLRVWSATCCELTFVDLCSA